MGPLGHTVRTNWSSHSLSQATYGRRLFLQQVDELTHGNVGLSKNCRKRPSGEFTVNRDNNRSCFSIPKLYVTTSLPDLFKTNLRERCDGLLAGNN
jgi:hypothetical protein